MSDIKPTYFEEGIVEAVKAEELLTDGYVVRVSMSTPTPLIWIRISTHIPPRPNLSISTPRLRYMLRDPRRKSCEVSSPTLTLSSRHIRVQHHTFRRAQLWTSSSTPMTVTSATCQLDNLTQPMSASPPARMVRRHIGSRSFSSSDSLSRSSLVGLT